MCEWNKKQYGFTKKFNVELFLAQSGFPNLIKFVIKQNWDS